MFHSWGLFFRWCISIVINFDFGGLLFPSERGSVFLLESFYYNKEKSRGKFWPEHEDQVLLGCVMSSVCSFAHGFLCFVVVGLLDFPCPHFGPLLMVSFTKPLSIDIARWILMLTKLIFLVCMIRIMSYRLLSSLQLPAVQFWRGKELLLGGAGHLHVLSCLCIVW